MRNGRLHLKAMLYDSLREMTFVLPCCGLVKCQALGHYKVFIIYVKLRGGCNIVCIDFFECDISISC
jgi:hypothetical protein